MGDATPSTSRLGTAAGIAAIAAATIGAPLLGRRQTRWGATPEELRSTMAGDDHVPQPHASTTRAITIAAPPEAVWRWVVQIGQGRGGLYSYDGVENLVGCDLHSADEVVEPLQHPAVGDLISMGPPGYPCYRIARLDPPTGDGSPATMVLFGADPKSRQVVDDAPVASTWQWQLRPLEGGRRTRLVTRQRLTYPPRQRVLWALLAPVSYAMERQMLRGIAERAERTTSDLRSR